MLRLARYLKEFIFNVTIGPACKLTEAIFELIVPLIMADIIDIGIANGDTAYIWKKGLTLVILAAAGLTCAVVCQYMASRASQGVGTRLRDDLCRHINSLSCRELDKFGTPALITIITNDVNAVQQAVAMLIRLVVRAPFLVIGATAMSFAVSPRLSLIFLAAMALIVAVMYPVMKASVKLFRKQQKALDGISRITRENLEGVRVVRAFSRQDYEKARFDEKTEEYRRAAVRAGRINALLDPAIFVVVNVAYLALAYFGGGFAAVGTDGLTQGKVIALINYMTQISLALVVVANLVGIFTRAAASSARINEVFDTESSVRFPEHDPDTRPDAPALEFENVCFSYVDGKNSLENISFILQRGQTVGVIGGTGSGKTTLSELVRRAYDRTGGTIRINGADIKEFTAGTLCRLVAVVPQKAELLSGTLRENLTMGRTDIPDEVLWQALETAQARDFTEKLDGGLDAVVLQGGKNFSGGQKQRLTIARAVAQGAEILILDDSSSALDYGTDAKLREALKAVPAAKIIISQRTNSIMDADNILVLDEGKALGYGKHEMLLETCSVYKEIFGTQQ